jgi:hypothetical protein
MAEEEKGEALKPHPSHFQFCAPDKAYFLFSVGTI